MDRQDQIFFSAVGGALIAGILVAVIFSYATSQTAAEWSQSLLTVGAIFVAIAVPRWSDMRRLEGRQRVAEVIVATSLRSWLRKAANEVDENLLHLSSEGHDGTESFDIPPFEIPFAQIAEMRERYAKEISNLIERRERRQDQIYWERRFGDDYGAIIEYFEHTAHLFWSARRLYQEIAKHRGLEIYTNPLSEIQAIKRAADKAQKHRELENEVL